METYEVHFTNKAEQDFMEILLYISETLKEPVIAARLYDTLKRHVQSLDHMPLRYAVVEEEPYRTYGVRKIPVENYTAFYIVEEEHKKVHVLRILYNRREWQNLL